MSKASKLQPLSFPDKYSLSVKPSEAVRVGTEVFISITYEKGDYNLYTPTLELLDGPEGCPETPVEWGKLVESGKTTTFKFIAEKVGVYTLRLRPFSHLQNGQLIEIHAISEQEETHVATITNILAQIFTEKH